MKTIRQLNLGFNDAENYQKRENKELFNSIFVKNFFLDELLQSSTYFLVGEKGTGKTAYAVFLANNVYYETVIRYDNDKTDLLGYALEKKVIPVSPNLLYAYLMTVVMGLHGLQIEKQAAEIRQTLQKLSTGLTTFLDNWQVLGKHLRNAQSQYDDANTKLNKFTLQLENIQAAEGKPE